MALGARTSPEVIVHGTVASSRGKSYDGKDNGQAVEIGTDGGGIVVGFKPDQRGDIAPIGTVVALVATVFDSQNGSYLSFSRYLTENDFDSIASATGLGGARKAS